MKVNFFKNDYREISKNRYFYFLNLSSFIIGLTCLIFVIIYVYHEFSYDKYHKNYKRIYRIGTNLESPVSIKKFPVSSFPFGQALQDEFPEIECFTRFIPAGENACVIKDLDKFVLKNGYLVDSTIFKMFTYKFIVGSPNYALTEPNSIVLTQSLAKKINIKSIGETILVSGRSGDNVPCKVTGIIEDIKPNSFMQFTALISMNSISNIYGKTFYERVSKQFLRPFGSTFIMFRNNSIDEKFFNKLGIIFDKYIKNNPNLNTKISFNHQALKDLHFGSGLSEDLPTSNITTIYILIMLSLFILLLITANYFNIETAISLRYSKVIAVRKVFGDTKGNLMLNSLFKSCIISLFSLLIALSIVLLVFPYFTSLIDTEISREILIDPLFILILIPSILLVGLISGIYPAFVISSLSPLKLFRNDISNKMSIGKFRIAVSVFQIMLAIFVLFSGMIVNKQFNLFQNKDLGFKKENVFTIRVDDRNFLNSIYDFEKETKNYKEINNISISDRPIDQMEDDISSLYVEIDNQYVNQFVVANGIDDNFLDMFGINIIKGRNFDIDKKTDKRSIIINETAVKRYGWTQNPIGKKLKINEKDTVIYEVIGVVKDFYFGNLKNEVSPCIFFYIDFGRTFGKTINLTVIGKNTQKALGYVHNKMLDFKYNDNYPFVYLNLESVINNKYKNEKILANIYNILNVFCILITMFGILCLISFMVERENKVNSIRKVVGATTKDIYIGISKKYFIYTLVAYLLSIPIAYYFMHKWIMNFANRVEIGIWPCLQIFLVVTVLIQIIISFQTYKAANKNPVSFLRNE